MNAGRVVVGGCFGIRSVAGLARFSYKSKNSLFGGPLLLDEPHSAIDMDRAAKDQAVGPDGVGCRDVVVAVGVCDFHGETVAEAAEWGQ